MKRTKKDSEKKSLIYFGKKRKINHQNHNYQKRKFTKLFFFSREVISKVDQSVEF